MLIKYVEESHPLPEAVEVSATDPPGLTAAAVVWGPVVPHPDPLSSDCVAGPWAWSWP